MEFDRKYYSGKTAAVTGGASGIGLALCEELLESGAKMVTMADFNRANLALCESRLNERYPGKVKAVFCDVTDETNVKRMLEQALAFGGGCLDLLINCAGAGFVGKFVETRSKSGQDNRFFAKAMTNENWKDAFALNFFGPLYGCRHALAIMLGQGSGQIVNIISGIAFSPMAYQSMYAATKSALNVLTLSLRAEYEGYNIKINSATPGTTATAIFGNHEAPQDAQSPRQSAQRILDGVAKNDRLILGDDPDLEGARSNFLPDLAATRLDKVFLAFAHMRRDGSNSYSISEEPSADEPTLQALKESAERDLSDMDALEGKLRAYLAQRETEVIPEGHFEGKTAVVTGATSGVGLALCGGLLKLGAKRVAMVDSNIDDLNVRVRSLDGLYPGKVLGIPCDVSAEAEVKAMVASAAEFFAGRFDILINCTGIGQSGMFCDVPDGAEITARSHMSVEPPARWEQVFGVNFYGPLYACRAVLPLMAEQECGQIVNIISGTAFSGMPYQSVHASAEAALGAMTLVLRYEYWDDGVKVNSATSGTTSTAICGEKPNQRPAQTPELSALRILSGIAKNERLIFGGDDDAINAILWGNAKVARFWDKLFSDAAGARRAGN